MGGSDVVLLQQIISGLATGCLYALVALALVLIFKTTDVVNFAQGEMAMVSAFFAFTMMMSVGLPYWGAFAVALLFAAILGIVLERAFIRSLHHSALLNLFIMTIGLMMVLNGVAGWFWGFEPYNFPVALSGEPIHLGQLVITMPDIMNFVVTCVIMLVFYLVFKYSLVGIAMRAVAENRVVSRLMGVRVNKILSTTWAIGAMLGAVAGIFFAPITFLDINMMADVIIKAFTAAVLGGFNSLPGAVVGGLLLGVIENMIAGYISTELKGAFSFALIVIVLCIRPTGLLGTVERKKV
jgi:branched-chain amino acid transport system permease protein